MKQSREAPNLDRYLKDSLTILSTAVQLYHAGNKAQYRVAALQLRLLLCDTTRRHGKIVNISLLPRLIPEVTLPQPADKGFLAPNARLKLKAWLDQPLPGAAEAGITVRQFIRRVCEQDGGAHVDPKPQAGLAGITDREEKIIRLAETVLEALARF